MGMLGYLDVWSLDPKCQDGHGGDAEHWVALDPQARCFLLDHGVADSRIDTEIGHVSSKRREFMVETSRQIQHHLRERVCFPDFGDLNWSLSELCLWYCYWVINYCIWVLELNDTFYNLYKPDRLRAGQLAIISHRNGYIYKEDGFFAQLTASFAAARNVEFQGFTVKELFRDRALGLLKQGLSPVRDSILNNRARAQYEKLIVALDKGGARPILVSSTYPPMTRLVERLQKRIAAPAYVLNGKDPEPFAGCFNVSGLAKVADRNPELQILEDQLSDFSLSIEKETELFAHAGVSFAALLAKKFRAGVIPAVISAYGRSIVIEKILRQTKPQAFLAIGDMDGDLLAGALCRRLNIAGIMVFHGSMIVPKIRPEYTEVSEQTIGKLQSSYPYLALQTPLMEKHCQGFPSMSKKIRTGPLVIGNKVRVENAQKMRHRMLGDRSARVIMHASTPKGGNAVRFHIYETFNEYVQSIKELVEAVESLPDTHLVVKFRPNEWISVDNIRMLVPFSDKVTLSIDEPFPDVLGFTDLLVSFTSTTIEEALINRVPVLLYGANGRNQYVEAPVYEPDTPLPVSPVYAINESVHLSAGLEEILEHIRDIEPKAFDPFCYTEEQIEPLEEAICRIVEQE